MPGGTNEKELSLGPSSMADRLTNHMYKKTELKTINGHTSNNNYQHQTHYILLIILYILSSYVLSYSSLYTPE